MSTDLALLLLAGVGAGLCGSVAGLASVVSYPALLAFGLPPVTANVTNCVAMFATTAGSVSASQPELRGQGRRLLGLAILSCAGGGLGAALLLTTPAKVFEEVVPWLVALGAGLLLARDRLRTWVTRRRSHLDQSTGRSRWWAVLVLIVGVYGGYFGAGMGIILLAVLAVRDVEPLAVTNAVKSVAAGTANGAAAVAYAFLAPVDWAAAFAIGGGALLGSMAGPRIVRIAPETPLRWGIALAGFGLAAYLAIT